MSLNDKVWLIAALLSTPLYIGAYLSATRGWHIRDRIKPRAIDGRDKASSWIITGVSSLLVTLGSLPFVLDYILGGFHVSAVARRPLLSQVVAGNFLSYLFCDITVGILCYRTQVAWLTGWGHHFAYIVMLSYAGRQGWMHLFALGAIEEFPTAVLATGILFPRYRSDYLFASSFAVLRLVYHVAILVSLTTPLGQTAANLDGSRTLVPAFFYAPGIPLHIFWFYGCIRGIIRRRTKARKARLSPAVETIKAVEPVLVVSNPLSEIRERILRRRVVRGFRGGFQALRGGLKSTERRRFGTSLTNR